MNLNYDNLSMEQATEYKNFVSEWIPVGLADLADFMRATGGPIEEMDASIGSLTPLWSWALLQVSSGVDVVPAGLMSPALSARITEPGHEEHQLRSRILYFGHCIGAYLTTVCFEADSGAELVVFQKVAKGAAVYHLFHAPCVQTSAGETADLISLGVTVTAQIVAGYPFSKTEDRIRPLLLKKLPSLQNASTRVLGNSILKPLTNIGAAANEARPLNPRFEVSLTSGVSTAAVEALDDSFENESELSLVKGLTDDELDIRLLDPLDTVLIAELLKTIGGPSLSQADSELLSERSFETQLASGATFTTEPIHGALRAIFFERGAADAGGWHEVCQAVSDFATSTGSFFGRDDEWPQHDS